MLYGNHQKSLFWLYYEMPVSRFLVLILTRSARTFTEVRCCMHAHRYHSDLSSLAISAIFFKTQHNVL